MGYDKDGKWINPRSVKRECLSNDTLSDMLAAMTRQESAALLYTIRTGEKLSERDNVIRWYLLRTIVRTHYHKRWRYYYHTKQWYKLNDTDYYDTQNVTSKNVITAYPEDQRILDLYEMIRTAPEKSSPEHTINHVLSRLFKDPGRFETLGTFKYRYGISFVKGDPKRNYVAKDIPSVFAILVHNFMYRNDYDFYKVLSALLKYYENKYDRYLKGELKSKQPKMTLEFVINVYSSLLRHFTAFEFGDSSTFSYDAYADEKSLETFVDSVPMEDAFRVVESTTQMYGILRWAALRLRNYDYENEEHLMKVIRNVVTKHTFLRERENIKKRANRSRRNYNRKDR